MLLAGGPVVAGAQSPGQSAPEWQQYDQVDDRFGALAWLTFGEVIGSEVVDEQATRVGSIVGLVRTKSDGMFYAVIDSREPAGPGDQVVPVDRLEVVGDGKESRQIVLAGDAGDLSAWVLDVTALSPFLRSIVVRPVPGIGNDSDIGVLVTVGCDPRLGPVAVEADLQSIR